jgi:DNA-binding NarL/FixJ family response regulator
MSISGNGAEPQRANVEGLTARELEVLKLIAEGHSTKRIADMLGVTFKTAACHRSRLLAKVGVHESVSLLRWAIRQGIIAP